MISGSPRRFLKSFALNHFSNIIYYLFSFYLNTLHPNIMNTIMPATNIPLTILSFISFSSLSSSYVSPSYFTFTFIISSIFKFFNISLLNICLASAPTEIGNILSNSLNICIANTRCSYNVFLSHLIEQ